MAIRDALNRCVGQQTFEEERIMGISIILICSQNECVYIRVLCPI